MERKDILLKAKNSGVRIFSGSATCYASEVITVYPHYLGNAGFFHVLQDDWEVLILKGIYKDNLRTIKGKFPHDVKVLNEISRNAAHIDSTIGTDLKLSFTVVEGKVELINAESAHFNRQSDGNFHIPRPITHSEIEEICAHQTTENTLWSRGLFHSLTPGTMSPLASSLLSTIPDAFNALFDASMIKTPSPYSIKIAAGKAFLNMNNYTKIMETLGGGCGFYNFNYAPWLHLKSKPAKFREIKTYYIDYNLSDMSSGLEELKDSYKSIGPHSIVRGETSEKIVQFGAISVMVHLNLLRHFAKLMNMFRMDHNAVMALVYRTRNRSLFTRDRCYRLPYSFDFNSPETYINFKTEHAAVSMTEIVKEYGFWSIFFKSKKVGRCVEEIHKLLDLRDELFLGTAAFALHLKDNFRSLGKKFVEDGLIHDIDELAYYEVSDLFRMFNNTFTTGNTTYRYLKKNQYMRHLASILPFDIYGKDFQRIYPISDDYYEKYSKLTKIPCIGYFPFNVVGKLSLSTPGKILKSQDVAILQNINPANLVNMSDAAAIVTEVAPMTSHMAEFAAISNKPLYTGVRYADILYKEKGAKTENDHIHIL